MIVINSRKNTIYLDILPFKTRLEASTREKRITSKPAKTVVAATVESSTLKVYIRSVRTQRRTSFLGNDMFISNYKN